MGSSILSTIFSRPDLAGLLCLGLFVAYVAKSYGHPKKGKPLPSPRGYPLVGNVPQMGAFPWYQMTKWSKEFGPIFQLNLMGRSTIILNSYRAATELLDQRSAIYSDRPRMIMLAETLCGGYFFAFIRIGETWRWLRKVTHEGLTPRLIDSYSRFQEREAVILVQDLINDPAAWVQHIHRAIASNMLGICYAFPPALKHDDPIIIGMENFVDRLEHSARPGSFLVENLPWLNYLPEWIAPFKQYGNGWHRHDTEMFAKLYQESKQLAKASGQSGHSIGSVISQRDNLDEKTASWLVGTLYAAGTATTASVHQVFVMAMLLHPEIMAKAQAEIDTVVGRGRMPIGSDKETLPYLRAVMREVIRWRTIGPLGLPHYLNEDDVYEGYHVPKNSVVLFNEWAMNHDPEVYEEPHLFKPERFLDETQQHEILPQFTHGEGHTLFGYGRRRCPGHSIANATMLMNMATLLWAFNLEKGVDEKGNVVTPDPDNLVNQGLVVVPSPFPVKFTPRDPDNLGEMLSLSRAHHEEAVVSH